LLGRACCLLDVLLFTKIVEFYNFGEELQITGPTAYARDDSSTCHAMAVLRRWMGALGAEQEGGNPLPFATIEKSLAGWRTTRMKRRGSRSQAC
jgi:hypothetical protein